MEKFTTASSIFELAQKATEKLSVIEITSRIKRVLPLMSEIIKQANRFTQLSGEEKSQVKYTCFEINAYLDICDFQEITLKCASQSAGDLAGFRRDIENFSAIFDKIGSDWLKKEVVFELPPRIDDDLLGFIEKILKLNKSKIIAFNMIPLELAPFMEILETVQIRTDSPHVLETSLVALQHSTVRPGQNLLFGPVCLKGPVTFLTLKYIRALYEAHKVTVASSLF